MLFCVILSSRI